MAYVADISISVRNISKSFGATKAVDDVSLEVSNGELFGLIGPDGAGKTTLFKMMTSLLRPDHGVITVHGLQSVRDYRKIRKSIGYMPGDFSLYRDLTVRENLRFFASIFNTTIEENYHLIKDIYSQLEPFERRRADKLSGGMKQKLALCCALIHEPTVLFLDEPTTGVDAVSRDEFWDMLDRLIERGISIMVSTPYMDEASRCQRVALIQHGRILQIDKPHHITSSYPYPLYQVKSDQMFSLPKDIRSMDFCVRAERFGEYIHMSTNKIIPDEKISTGIKQMGHQQVEVERIEASIEDVFLNLIS